MLRVLVVSLSVLAVDALAQGDANARAREAYLLGQSLYKDGRYREAAVKFEEANTLSPRPGNYFNIARCYEQVNEVAKALAAYRAYLRVSPSAPPEKADVDAAIARLQGQLKASGVQQLTVLVEPATVRAMVTIDGRPIGASPATTELPAGTHTLVVEAPGYLPLERKFQMGIELASDIPVKLLSAGTDVPVQPPPQPPAATTQTQPPTPPAAGVTPLGTEQPRPRKPYIGAWITTGLTVAAVGVGILLYVLAGGVANDLRNPPSGPRTLSQNQDLVNSGTGLQTGAFISFGGAGALALTSVLLFIFEGK